MIQKLRRVTIHASNLGIETNVVAISGSRIEINVQELLLML